MRALCDMGGGIWSFDGDMASIVGIWRHCARCCCSFRLNPTKPLQSLEVNNVSLYVAKSRDRSIFIINIHVTYHSNTADLRGIMS